MTRNYWTPKRDEELKRHKAAGLSASKIAALLHTARNAVLGRTNRLRNRPSQVKIEQLKRQRAAAAETRKKAVAEKREKAAAEAREKAQAHQDKILAAMRADLAAGIDRSVVIKRAIGAGAKSIAVAEFFGLSHWQVYQIVGPGNISPQWTDKQVELLLSMWSDHSAQEIADALGTTRGAVLGKIWRVGLRSRRSKNSASAPGYPRPRARSGFGSRAAASIRS
jgi:hypothetical protein